jgi:hypothetical protein
MGGCGGGEGVLSLRRPIMLISCTNMYCGEVCSGTGPSVGRRAYLKAVVCLPTWSWRLPAPVTRYGRSPVRSSPQ